MESKTAINRICSTGTSLRKSGINIEKMLLRNISVFFFFFTFFFSEMIQKFDISPRQGRVAIVEYSTRASLSVAFDNYGSKTRLMCAVKALRYSGNWGRYGFLMTTTRLC